MCLYKKNQKENYQNIDIKSYKELMFKNYEENNKNLYKIGLNNNIKIQEEDCDDKCDKQNCIKMHERKKILNECLQCNIQKKKCFHKSIIGGNCDDCDIDNIEDKLNCYDVNHFGCPNPENINDYNGISHYYIELNDNSINSPFNKKCVFCWNIVDNI
jgi:hypothetical protein